MTQENQRFYFDGFVLYKIETIFNSMSHLLLVFANYLIYIRQNLFSPLRRHRSAFLSFRRKAHNAFSFWAEQ